MRVKDVMTREPLTIDPDASLKTAAEQMRTAGVRHLPVISDKGILLEILTDRDV